MRRNHKQNPAIQSTVFVRLKVLGGSGSGFDAILLGVGAPTCRIPGTGGRGFKHSGGFNEGFPRLCDSVDPWVRGLGGTGGPLIFAKGFLLRIFCPSSPTPDIVTMQWSSRTPSRRTRSGELLH